MSAQEIVHVTSPLFWGLWWCFLYPLTDSHISQLVDNDTSISELVDKVLIDI